MRYLCFNTPEDTSELKNSWMHYTIFWVSKLKSIAKISALYKIQFTLRGDFKQSKNVTFHSINSYGLWTHWADNEQKKLSS